LEQPEALAYGVEVSKVGLKDVILPGDLRTIMNRVIEAEKAAQAALIAAREEVATLRTRQNAAHMIAENPNLLELIRIEAMKEMAESGSHTFVFGGPASAPPLKTPAP
jgi:regulator of protease activity HflC (stomatin/prohibitin superfamily)